MTSPSAPRALTTLTVALVLGVSNRDSAVADGCRVDRARAEHLVARISSEWPLRGGDDVAQYVRGITKRLAKASGYAEEWHVAVVRNREANAFSIAGNYIYVTDGSILAARSDSEIAASLAHEIAHTESGHFCEPLHVSELNAWFRDLWHGDGETQASAGSVRVEVDGAKEQEADRLAVRILQSAGYDPTAVLAVVTRACDTATSAEGRFVACRRRLVLDNLLEGRTSRADQMSGELRAIQQLIAGGS